MKSLLFAVSFGILMLALAPFILGDLSTSNQNRLDFSHVVYITNINTPNSVAPGSSFNVDFNITNEGNQFVRDVVARIILPSKISSYNDVTNSKVAQLNSGESANLRFRLIVSPDATEGLYNLPLTVDYVNAAGEEREENETLGILVGSIPELFAEVKTAEIYKGNEVGKITVTIANNGVGNIKFLTAEINDSPNYEILNTRKIYVGDLNSDDTQGVDFKIQVKRGLSKVSIPVILTYKDALNKDYYKEVSPVLYIVTASELGIKKSNTGIIFFVIIVLGVAGWIIYKKYFKKKKFSFKTS